MPEPINVSIKMMPQTFNALDLGPNQEVDLSTLMDVISNCFKMNRDGRYTPEDRDAYLAKGKALSKRQDKLLGKYFIDGVDEVKKANAEIKKVKDATDKALKKMEKIADTIEQLGALINSLDNVIKLIPKV